MPNFIISQPYTFLTHQFSTSDLSQRKIVHNIYIYILFIEFIHIILIETKAKIIISYYIPTIVEDIHYLRLSTSIRE